MSGQRLFISYDSEDSAAVEPIVAYLEAQGAACWIASRDIPPRSIYAEAITQAMRDAEACIVVVSERANHSDAIKRELELASHYRKPFIPIRIDGVEPGPGLDYYLRNTQWIDYKRERNAGLDRIVRHMKGDSVAAPAPLRSYPPSSTPPTNSPNRSTVVAIAAALVAAVGSVIWVQSYRSPPSTLESSADINTTSDRIEQEREPTITANTTPRVDTAAQEARLRQEQEAARQRQEAARLQRERDDALAAARASDERLERERREIAERSRQQEAERNAAIAQSQLIGSTWLGNVLGGTWGLRLDPNGVACFNMNIGTPPPTCTPGNWTWTLNGTQLSVRNPQNQIWLGTVSGRTYSGSTSFGGDFTLTRQN